MPKRKPITFTVDENQKEEIQHYAKTKGFDTASNLARMAIFAYMRKNALKPEEKLHSCTAVETDI
jgi:hypothetical protein